MYILGIETTGKIGSAALYNSEDERIYYKETTEDMGHLRNIAYLINDLMQENHIKKSEISKIAVSVGPGSYTGIRICVSTARALAQGLGVPCIPVGALDEFRLYCKSSEVAVIFNARRGQVYGAIFDVNGRNILPPGPYMLEDVLNKVNEEGINPKFYGDGIDAYRDKLEAYELAPVSERYPRADLVVKMAKESELEVDYQNLLPDYMRETEAEQKLRDGTLAKLRAAKMEKFRNQ